MFRVTALLLACTALAAAATPHPGAKHIVVLMFENRSFDHMLGMLKGNNTEIDGCLPKDPRKECSNPLDPLVPGSKLYPTDDKAIDIQPADPNHSVPATTEQVYGYGPTDVDPAPMTGFVKNYAESKVTDDGTFIMECFAPPHVPVITTLASEFATFNTWHAAVPGPTEVNRAFAWAATSDGMANNDDLRLALGLPTRTVWADLNAAGIDWDVYFEDFPTPLFQADVRGNLSQFHFTLDGFKEKAANGTLAPYTWIDPAYFDIFNSAASDQHPDHDVAEGEAVMKEVYEALRNGPKWNETVLLITYDEHGGFFDHVPPTACPSPDGKVSTNPPFNFTRLGVRIPAVLVSPYVSKGKVVGAPATGHYETSSIPHTIREQFTDAPPLTARDAYAANFLNEMDLSTPRTDCPTTLPNPIDMRSMGKLPELNGQMPISDLQKTFLKTAAGMNGNAVEEVDSMTESAAALRLAHEVNTFFGEPKIVISKRLDRAPTPRA